jgi:RNA polymerase sigma-70 factor (ECF subfamily)
LEGLSGDFRGVELGLTEQEAAKRFYTHLWPHRATILRTARFLTRNAADAEDLAQETLMRAFRNVAQFNVAGNAKGWLTTVLRHVQIDRSRVRSSALVSEAISLDAASAPAAPTASPQSLERDPRDLAALVEAFSDQAFIDALKSLPEELRWTLLLVDVEQMSYEDAAIVMDVPAGTVKSRVHRARGLLRDRMLTSMPAVPKAIEASGNKAGWRIP